MSRKSVGGQNRSQQQPVQEAHNEPVIELENQFLLRLPEEPAAALREALRSGASNIKERLSIQLQPESHTADPRLRRGIVEFDGWNMSAKLIDLPTVVESQKTIDRKTFYKTADICQILSCKEGEPSDEDEAPPPDKQPKKFDPNKVDKKFLFPHGVCPPLKNCRKRRFRKTLKKKYIDAPENEKEVKHLFRNDLEAIRVKWELMTEDEINAEKGGKPATSATAAAAAKIKKGEAAVKEEKPKLEIEDNTVDEKDLFGERLSDSDEEKDTTGGNIEVDSEADSNLFSPVKAGSSGAATAAGPTEFSADMFKKEDTVAVKMGTLSVEIEQLRNRKSELENHIASCQNSMLAQRFKLQLASLEEELKQRMEEQDAFSMFNM